MTVVTLGELQFGAHKSQQRDKALAVIQSLTQVWRVETLPEAAGEHCGQIRAALQGRGQIIGSNDLWLAAHARAEGWGAKAGRTSKT